MSICVEATRRSHFTALYMEFTAGVMQNCEKLKGTRYKL